MTPEIRKKLHEIVIIAEYLLNTDKLAYSSDDEGFDKVLNAYCFFNGNLVEHQTYYIHSDFVKYETPLANACKLSDLIRGKHDT